MKLTRRHIIAIAASFAASPALPAQTQRWHARALGSDVDILLQSTPSKAARLFAQIEAQLRRIERLFSLYDPSSTLSRLNATGTMRVSKDFTALCLASTQAHQLTNGLFDPTIQPLWRALASSQNPASARNTIGWQRVKISGSLIELAPGQALSFNGIAQGFATDLITQRLYEAGARQALVNIGEHRALGGPYRLGLPQDGHVSVKNRAIATSQPAALKIGGTSHILGPNGQIPRWSHVTVEAKSATLADALSTALCFASLDQIKHIQHQNPDISRIWISDANGRTRSL